ncbi:MAG TPA: endonuclease/exonuclease/phosphatase family protein [Actinomycetota bacterium]|nr:endonuclease/exonuclease/phosphatase family protein [Actinomycetota bacterium]
MRRIRSVVAVTLALATLPGGLAAASGQTADPVTVRVMTFNIWYGATPTHGLDEVVDAIELADADVIGMQEPYARLRRIASALGFYVSPRMHVISRYPILEPAGTDGGWAYLLLGPGRVAAIANTHLPCCPYTPYRIVHKGFTRREALEQEANTRVRKIERQLAPLGPLIDASVPTFFTGDFNTPSHRDWTPAAVEARGLPYPIRWPVSLAMEEAGFVDSYRAVHPDPVADPGFTWTPGYPAPFVYDWDVHDRIDFVWAAGPAMPMDSRVVGESRTNADLVIAPYPTDHRGVVSTFEVTPASPPVFVAADRERSRPGRALDVWFHSAGGADEHVRLVEAASGTVVAEVPTGPEPTVDGTVAFDTTGLVQGPYDLLLLDGSGAELARDHVVLVAHDQDPILTLADGTLEGAQRLEVAWTFAPGNRYDWLGVFRAGRTAKTGSIKAWRYLEAQVDGSTTIGPGARGAAGWPLPPGDYELHLCLDDSYRCRVSAPFTVLG